MTTPTEAMRLALEALEIEGYISTYGDFEFNHKTWMEDEKWHPLIKRSAAITALRDALSAAPQPPAAQQGEADPLHLSRVLHELAGAASLCWEPKPSGVFDSSEAIKHVEAALKEIRGRLAAAPQPVAQGDANPMTAHRAAWFLERFKREEKLLGPNEQKALLFAIDALERLAAAPAGVAGEPLARVVRLPGRYSNPKVEWIDGAAVRIGMELFAAPPARQALPQNEVDAIINASREADEGPTGLARRTERAHGIGGEGGANG